MVKKMGWHKLAKNVGKTTDTVLSEASGTEKPSKSLYIRVPRKAGLFKKSHSHEQMKKTMLEIEFKKTRAMMFARRFQNR